MEFVDFCPQAANAGSAPPKKMLKKNLTTTLYKAKSFFVDSDKRDT